MNNIASLKTGTTIKITTFGEAKLVKGGRAGIPVNRLYGRVTKRATFTAEVSGPGKYEERQKALGNEVKGESPWYTWTGKDGIVSHPSGKEYLAILPSQEETPSVQYFVDGNPATQGEKSEISRFRSGSGSESLPVMLTLDLDKIESVEIL